MEKNENLASDYRCLACGDSLGKTKKLYCASHSTALGRKEMAVANEQIKQENLAKGYVYQ